MHSSVVTYVAAALVSLVGVGITSVGLWYFGLHVRRNLTQRDPLLPAYVRYSTSGREKVPARLKWARILNLGRPVKEGTMLYRLQEKLDERHIKVSYQLLSYLHSCNVLLFRTKPGGTTNGWPA